MAEASDGLRLTGSVRTGACGTWWAASTSDGRARGMLQIDPALASAPGAIERGGAAVVAVRNLKLPGVLRTAEMVAEDTRVWLIAATPPTVTLSELFARSVELDPASAVFLALDIGQTLSQLHESGLVHGALTEQAVMVTPAGSAALIEVGLLAALRGLEEDPSADAASWAAIVRKLAIAPGAGAATEPLTAAAREVESGGAAALTPAVAALTQAAASLPGFPSRAFLAAAHVTAAQAAAAPAMPAASPPPPSTKASTVLPAKPGPLAATQLGRRAARATGAAANDAPASSTAIPASSTETPGAPADGTARLRFGPGVPTTVPVRDPNLPAAAPRGRRRRRWPVLSGALTLLILAGSCALLWWRFADALEIRAATVTAQPVSAGCDATVDVLAAVETNGRSGVLRYQWLRNDGQASDVYEQKVGAGTSTVHLRLRWSFSGEGEYDASARLKIFAPTPSESKGSFSYRC